MDTGIGVDGYSIIGQGKISEILSNKTESRREIFEEAAGIVLYRTKRQSPSESWKLPMPIWIVYRTSSAKSKAGSTG